MKKFNIIYWIVAPIILILGAIATYIFEDERFAIGSAVLATIAMYLIIPVYNKAEKKIVTEGYSVERTSEKYSKEKKRIQELMEEYSYFSIKHEIAISEPISISNIDNSKAAIEDFNWFKGKLENEKFNLNVTNNIYENLLELVESRIEHLEELCEDDRGLLGEIIEIEEEDLNDEIMKILI